MCMGTVFLPLDKFFKKKEKEKNVHFGVGGVAVACVVAGGGAGQCTLFVPPLSIEVSQILAEISLVNWYRSAPS